MRRLIASASFVALMIGVALFPSAAWAVCGTDADPCVTRVVIDPAQDAALDDLKLAGGVGLGVVVFTQLVMLVGGWGRRG